ncbi:uncharacterized protein LOC121858326 isoform X5 [Homarus americanus]|uniref:uncharacterized protein LOC121858326 isoform X5 n=1 Tax=Homarus americanus TaxID=6706 RepID=UPI001C48DDD6|nr:uncharacterized protein LOC121858326 isoform X5 [Homarus americanus]
MGACIARCWPLIADPRYQPVRSRYLIHDETVQTQPSRLSSISTRLRALLARLRPKAEDEVELTPHLEQQDISDPPPTTTSRVTPVGGGEQRWWGLHGAAAGSLPSLTEPESPPTTSLDLEWEPEAGLARASRESLREEERSQTAESNSWVPRSSCSTPNSLEWDFRASTLSLRGGMEDETWQHTDLETEQLLQEIEQLAARALADTGHGLQPPPR